MARQKAARSGFRWEKTTKNFLALLYTNYETAISRVIRFLVTIVSPHPLTGVMKDSPKQPLTPTEERAVSSTHSRAFAEASLSSGTLWQRAAGLLNYGLPIYALAVSAA